MTDLLHHLDYFPGIIYTTCVWCHIFKRQLSLLLFRMNSAWKFMRHCHRNIFHFIPPNIHLDEKKKSPNDSQLQRFYRSRTIGLKENRFFYFYYC